MTLQPTSTSFAGYEPLFTQAERRRFQRVNIDLFGRYMLESRSEHHCQTVDVSLGGIRLFAPVKPKIAERIIVYIDALGRFSGDVVQVHAEGFSMTIHVPAQRREMLADKLTWFANRLALNLTDQRRHERIVPFQKWAILRSTGGGEHIVKILDLSSSGVSVEANTLPAIGDRVSIGKSSATVVRHLDCGFAAEFVDSFHPGEIDEATRL